MIQDGEANTVVRKLSNPAGLPMHVIELENDWIGLAAIETWVSTEVSKHVGLRSEAAPGMRCT